METKTLLLNECDLKFSNSEGQFSGYANVFSVLDSKNDIVMPGAFAEYIKTGNEIPVHVNHDWMNGRLPVGKWADLKEDSRGLFGAADLVMKMPSAIDAYWAVKSKLVTGLSIAAIPDKKSIERNAAGNRLIYNYKYVKEISIVDEPANADSTILNVKFAEDINSLQDMRDFERFLREAGNFNRDMCKMLVSQAKIIFGQRDAGNVVDAKSLLNLQQRLESFAVQK